MSIVTIAIFAYTAVYLPRLLQLLLPLNPPKLPSKRQDVDPHQLNTRVNGHSNGQHDLSRIELLRNFPPGYSNVGVIDLNNCTGQARFAQYFNLEGRSLVRENHGFTVFFLSPPAERLLVR